MKKILMAALCCIGIQGARADYSEVFIVQTPQGKEIKSGSTVLCVDPSLVNGGYYNAYYDYDKTLKVRNFTSTSRSFSCILTWGSYPTKEDYIAHNEERIPGTLQYVYGHPKMCNTQGSCYGDNIPVNLGKRDHHRSRKILGRRLHLSASQRLFRTRVGIPYHYLRER